MRDSRSFTLCQIAADDRFLHRKFANVPDRADDPFVSIETRSAPSGAPIISRAMSYLDCQMVRHVDLECDYRLFVGQVVNASLLNDSPPAVIFGDYGAA